MIALLCTMAFGSDLPLPSRSSRGDGLFVRRSDLSVGTGLFQEPPRYSSKAYEFPRANVHLTFGHAIGRSRFFAGVHTAFQAATFQTALRVEPRMGLRIGDPETPIRIDLTAGWSVDTTDNGLVHSPVIALSPKAWLPKQGTLRPWFVHVDFRLGVLRTSSTTLIGCAPGTSCNVRTRYTPGGTGLLWGIGHSFGRVGATR